MSRVEIVVVVKVTTEQGVDPQRVAEEIKTGVETVVKIHPWLVSVEAEYLSPEYLRQQLQQAARRI